MQRLASLLPKIAALFGVVADPKARPPRPLRPEWQDRKKRDAKPRDGKPRGAKPQEAVSQQAKQQVKPQEVTPEHAVSHDASPNAPAESAVAVDN